tara:strand:+ start:363 stop:1049 length:687 start_codon:yes stop_codon:yes gene_type:complete
MAVISLVTGKGGVGKSTLSYNLAGSLAELGKKVILIDADNEKPDSLGIYSQGIPEQDIDNFKTLTSNKDVIKHKDTWEINFDIVLSKPNELRNQISDLNSEYDYVIIDTPPNYSSASVKSVALSNLSIIVAAPSFSDENAVGRTFDTIDMGTPIIGIMNKIIKSQKLSKRLINIIDESHRPFLHSKISDKVSIKESAYAGMYVGDYDKDSQSHKEFQQLAIEINNHFN